VSDKCGRAVVLAVVLGVLAVMTPAVAATSVVVQGTVVCNSGREVSGVWIESTGGGSYWAAWTPYPKNKFAARFTHTVKFSGTSTTVHASVGCGKGRKSGSWASSNATPKAKITKDYVLNAFCADPVSGNGSCATAPMKSKNKPGPDNFHDGWCTDGAQQMWLKATGYNPSWNGNAIAWATNAKAQGYKVTDLPMVNSIWVREYGAPDGRGRDQGHVGWVTEVKLKDDKIYFKVWEMNYRGKLKETRISPEKQLEAKMRFIIAPPAAPATKP
jgi:surface antigen